MLKPLILKNSIQKYSWGSHSAIQQMMGENNADEPWAELWMGAHPKAPSQVYDGRQWVNLCDFISRFPEKILGTRTAEKFNNTLPYLFKILAAGQPLSIQAHPNAIQAKIGYERESRAGIDMNAPDRNYKDSSHKPECICALSPFTGLKGFRKISSAIELLELYCPHGLAGQISELKKKDLKLFFKTLMQLPDSRKQAVIFEAVKNAGNQPATDPVASWVLRLYRQYPEDIGIISPLFLNLFCLEPGQALFLTAGELHAYLDGLGIELMANSDNVLRGGLTPKHVDVPELMNVLNFSESATNILLPETISSSEKKYPVLAEEFFLSAICVSASKVYRAPDNRSVEILLCVEGNANMTYNFHDKESIELKKGDSVLIPAAVNTYRISGHARFYKAGVPL